MNKFDMRFKVFVSKKQFQRRWNSRQGLGKIIFENCEESKLSVHEIEGKKGDNYKRLVNG